MKMYTNKITCIWCGSDGKSYSSHDGIDNWLLICDKCLEELRNSHDNEAEKYGNKDKNKGVKDE